MNKQGQKKEPELIYIHIPPEPGEPEPRAVLSKIIWDTIKRQQKHEKRKEQN